MNKITNKNNRNKYSDKEDNQKNIKKNLVQHLKQAIADGDEEKIALIKNLENEIEKYLLVKEVSASKELSEFYQDDINNVMRDGSFNIIQMILLKEIELLEAGDFEAIAMLNKMKKNAENKIIALNNIAINFHKNKMDNQQRNQVPQFMQSSEALVNIEVKSEYKTLIQFEGFHLERTLGGDYIQALDADIKNLVGGEIINSRPEDLSKNIMDQIKEIRHNVDNFKDNDGENKPIQGNWAKQIKQEEVARKEGIDKVDIERAH